MAHSVRLSQCMIVKNEEKNIRKALEWGKEIVFEQIVVDTGSEDRTVEIAKAMGASVFFFPWIDDFSEAKNFAISKAKGDWIVFLDADEYYKADSSAKILLILMDIERKNHRNAGPYVVRSSCINLDDKGQPFSIGVQDRIFRNTSMLRYHNRIHETLYNRDGSDMVLIDASKELSIYHTGYSKQAYEETKKLERNIRMLENEITEYPENYNAWAYLGDSMFAMESFDGAERAYLRVIANVDKVLSIERKENVFCSYFKLKYLSGTGIEEELCSIYEKAKAYGCTSPDLECWLGYWYYKKGDKKKTVLYFDKALQSLDQYQGKSLLDIPGALYEIYQILFYINKESGHFPEMIRYGVLSLRLNLYLMPIIKDIICLLKTEGGEALTGESTFKFLLKLYNPSYLKNRLFLLKVAKLAEFPALESRIYELFSEEEKNALENDD